MELRVSLDERDDPDEEQEIEVEGLPFVVSNEVIDSYGLKYDIVVDDHNMPSVKSAMQAAAQQNAGDGSTENKEACSLS